MVISRRVLTPGPERDGSKPMAAATTTNSVESANQIACHHLVIFRSPILRSHL